MVVAFLAALLLISGGLSVGRSYSGWDDMSIYSAQGYAIARQGSILAVDVAGPSARGYPVSIQLTIAAFRVLGLEGLPGSKLVFPFVLGSSAGGLLRILAQVERPCPPGMPGGDCDRDGTDDFRTQHPRLHQPAGGRLRHARDIVRG